MGRKTSTFNEIRRTLYKTQRLMGDAQAAGRGPAALAKRSARRKERRIIGRFLGKFGL